MPFALPRRPSSNVVWRRMAVHAFDVCRRMAVQACDTFLWRRIAVQASDSGPRGPDGCALDVEGCLLIAHEGFGSVWRLSPHAEPLDRIVSCAARATMNLANAVTGKAGYDAAKRVRSRSSRATRWLRPAA